MKTECSARTACASKGLTLGGAWASFLITPTLLIGVACSSPATGEIDRGHSTRASLESFRSAGVSTVFEKRCGSLDCHGSTSRNLRIYSSRGLRLPNDAGLVPGNGDTTSDEILSNYHSILSLEPERTNELLAGADPLTLLVVKKPLELEKHKGGPAMKRGDDAERCITTWLKEGPDSPLDKDACNQAAIFPKE